MKSIADAIDRLTRSIGRICAWMLIPMVLLAFAVVALRYVAGVGYPWLSECFVWLNGAIVLLAAADGLRAGSHVRVDLFYKGMSPRKQALVDFLGVWLLLMPMMGVVGYLTWPIARQSLAMLERSPTPDGLPFLYVLKLLVVVFCALVALQGLATSMRAFFTLVGAPAVERDRAERLAGPAA